MAGFAEKYGKGSTPILLTDENFTHISNAAYKIAERLGAIIAKKDADAYYNLPNIQHPRHATGGWQEKFAAIIEGTVHAKIATPDAALVAHGQPSQEEFQQQLREFTSDLKNTSLRRPVQLQVNLAMRKQIGTLLKELGLEPAANQELS